MKKILSISLLIVLLLIFPSLFALEFQEFIVCSADVKLCPDGSYVSRDQNSNCQFYSCQNSCGNNICEIGEADQTQCPACYYSYPACLAPCMITPGSCPRDCSSSLSCVRDSDCPVGMCANGKTYNQYSCVNHRCRAINYFADPCSTGNSPICNRQNVQTCCARWAKENDIITIQCVGAWRWNNNQCSFQCGASEPGNNPPVIRRCYFGCAMDNRCYNFGRQNNGMYCNRNGNFVTLGDEGDYCQNNYQCVTHRCRRNVCVLSSGRNNLLWQND